MAAKAIVVMEIEVVPTLSALAVVRHEWDRLWQELGQPSPYTSWTWVWAWVEANRLERRLFILLARDDGGTLVGIAPLQRVPLPVPGLGVLTFIGQETSISPDFLVQKGQEREFCEVVFRYVSGKRNLVGVVLKMAEPLGGTAPLLEPSFAERFGDAVIEQYSQRLIVKLPESYEVFLQTLSQKMRQEMRAARKKLAEDHTMEFCHGGEEDFNNRLVDLFTLNDRRWGQSGGRGVYDSLYPRLHDVSMLKVFSLSVDGRPAAGLSVLLTSDGVYAELAGFNYEVDARHLGRCFYGLIIEWAILKGYRFFDFSSGSEEYKLRFKPQIFPKYRVTITRSVFGAFLLEKSRSLGRRVRWRREPALV
jgi:CelD/BcsL family acetyltransferase involved in cellulose biosynthesis